MKIIYTYCILIILLLSSCHGKRLATTNFVAIDNLSDLNGKYINENNKLSRLFNIYNNDLDIDIFDLNFKTKDSLIVSYVDTAGYRKIGLKGKRKENYFEVYFSNARFYLPPVFMINNIDRLRIGKGEDEKLLIYKWDEHYGMLIPLAGGSASDEYMQSFSRYDKDAKKGLYVIKVDSKWGYANEKDSVVIAPVYDYAMPFRNGMAKVARNKQWGYIDAKNEEVIPLIYDTIMKPEGSIIRVCKNGKWGLIDSLNNEIAETKYDHMLSFGHWKYKDSLFLNLAEVQKDGKIGFINKQGAEVIPIEYDEIVFHPTYGKGETKYCRTRIGDKYGYASGYGILCKPVFDKAGKNISYNGFSPENQTLTDKIGRYTEVIYQGAPYLFTENGILYKYKKLGFFRENRLVVDFESGFYLDAK